MKSVTLFIFFIFLFNTGILSAHQKHTDNNSTSFTKTETVNQTKTPLTDLSLNSDFQVNTDMCCCGDDLCKGPGDMSCKSHGGDFSKEINLIYPTTKTQSFYNLLSGVDILFLKTNICNTKSSQKSKFHSTPVYISLQSFLI